MPTQTPESLQHFAIQDHLTFHTGDGTGNHDLVEARIATAASEATILLHGAHLTRWNPAGTQPVIYMSPKSAFAADKPIRGGIPVLYPWFASGWDGKHQPMHGFARVTEWTVQSTHLDPTGDVHLTLTLPGTPDLQKSGYGECAATLQFRIGKELSITLEVTNHGEQPIVFEEGLHTYFAVGDIHQTTTEGLQGTTYLDKRDNFAKKTQTDRLLHYTRDVDQVHLSTASPLTIHDTANHRDIHILKGGSDTTVTWNPWSVMTPTLPDLAPDSWEHFVCVETVNAADNRITLAPGQTHRMSSTVHITKTA